MGRASELGGSLLASKQRRDDKYNKDRESYEKKQALFSLIVPPLVEEANQWIQKDNIMGFDRNETLIKENRDASAAYAAAQNWMTIDKEIQEQGGSAFNYYANLNRPEAERRAAEELNVAGKPEAIGDYGGYQSQITKIVEDWATEQASTYETAMEHLRKIGTPEEYESIVALARSDARPDDIFGTLFQKARNYVTGTTKEERDEKAIQAIANSALGQNVDAFNEFQEEYKRTRDVSKATRFVEYARNLDTDSDGSLWTTDEKYKTTIVGKSLWATTTKTRTSLNNPNIIELPTHTTEKLVDFESLETDAERKKAEDDVARAAFAAFNFHSEIRTTLSPEGRQEFLRLVEAEPVLDDEGNNSGGTGRSLMEIEASPNIVNDFNRTSEIYSKILQDDQYVRDELEETIYLDQARLVINEFVTLSVNLLDQRLLGGMNDEAYETEFAKLMATTQTKLRLVQESNEMRQELEGGGQ
jgi:hypothetical protein